MVAAVQDHPRMRGEDAASICPTSFATGSPPHARGRQERRCASWQGAGITPACAGKTPLPRNRCQPRKDHPRMRGEDKGGARKRKQNVGSPPHARGRLDRDVDHDVHGSDHPRMRGEDVCVDTCLLQFLGSPPHARGRRWVTTRRWRRSGITPACAGKTLSGRVDALRETDHPRMRGEDV